MKNDGSSRGEKVRIKELQGEDHCLVVSEEYQGENVMGHGVGSGLSRRQERTGPGAARHGSFCQARANHSGAGKEEQLGKDSRSEWLGKEARSDKR